MSITYVCTGLYYHFGIVQKLVLETLVNFWFTPIGDGSKTTPTTHGADNMINTEGTNSYLTSSQMQLLGQRVACLCEVISSFRNRGYHIIEDLMGSVSFYSGYCLYIILITYFMMHEYWPNQLTSLSFAWSCVWTSFQFLGLRCLFIFAANCMIHVNDSSSKFTW